MNLVEEFTLLAYDDEGRQVIGTGGLGYALGGTLLAELVLAGRIGVIDGEVRVVDPAPVGDEMVDGALAPIVGEGRGREPLHWVRRLGPAARPMVLNHLVAGGVLRAEHSRVLLVFPRVRYPSAYGAEPPARAETRTRLRAAVEGTGAVDARTAALCALIEAAGMEKAAFPGMDRRELRTRLAEISQADWAAAAVRTAIRDVQHAVFISDGGSGGDGGGDGGGGGGGD
jgi:hypothetical protein